MKVSDEENCVLVAGGPLSNTVLLDKLSVHSKLSEAAARNPLIMLSILILNILSARVDAPA